MLNQSPLNSKYPTSLIGQLRRHSPSYALGVLLLGTQQSLMYGRDRLIRSGVNAIDAHNFQVASRVAGWAIAVIVGAAIVRVLSRRVIFSAGREVEYELRSELLSKLHKLGAAFFRKIPTGDILTRSTSDLGQVRLLTGFGVLNVFSTLFGLASALTLMLSISVKLTVAALAYAPLMALVTRFFAKRMFSYTRDNQKALGSMSDQVQASLAGVRIVRSLSLEGAHVASFAATNESYLTANLRLAKLRGAFAPMMGVVSSLGILTVFGYGGYLVLHNEISRGDFIAFWAGLSRLMWPMLALGFVVSIVQRGRASYERLNEIFHAVPDIQDGPLPAPAHTKGLLEVRDLSYTIGEKVLLDHVNFTLPEGTSLAIVGKTGSGKSVLASLLPRLLPTPKGSVFLDGQDICDLPVQHVRKHIGYAQQDAFLFSTTVAKNVGLSLPEHESEEARAALEHAASEAQISNEIKELPDGWHTVVGERGVQLSGGQRQRVALARAFMWKPTLLVLDDPLSAVDAKTESLILDAIDRQAAERSLILVTHRVAAAARCDSIVVLDDGKVVETGTHDELLANGGVYASFAEEQRREGELRELISSTPFAEPVPA
jgi:ATP-binding cassette, subfamily B, multidrug efflux pump